MKQTKKAPKNANELFPGKYLKPVDIQGIVSVTIHKLDLEDFTDPKTKETETKPVLRFVELEKALILNKTNTSMLTQKLGNDIEQWSGKDISLEVRKVESFGELVEAIRVV